MTQNTEESEPQPPVFWLENELGETRPYRFFPISTTPPPMPLKEVDREKFVKELRFRLSVYQYGKSLQESIYGKEIAALYRPGYEPPELVEARKQADAQRLAEMEASDSDDHRMLARKKAALPAPEDQMYQSLPRKKRRRDTRADGIDNGRRVKIRKTSPTALTPAAAVSGSSPVEPRQPLTLAEPAPGTSASLIQNRRRQRQRRISGTEKGEGAAATSPLPPRARPTTGRTAATTATKPCQQQAGQDKPRRSARLGSARPTVQKPARQATRPTVQKSTRVATTQPAREPPASKTLHPSPHPVRRSPRIAAMLAVGHV
ncbi:hypothetical protein B0J18DRAFT_439701, partial [Chaetomium sp. MPI-SDFR-AT-0129]